MAGRDTTRVNSLPVREVHGEPDEPPAGWPYTIPAVRQLLADGLELAPVTVLVGPNGVGKSTVLEAVAMAYGLTPGAGAPPSGPSPERPSPACTSTCGWCAASDTPAGATSCGRRR